MKTARTDEVPDIRASSSSAKSMFCSGKIAAANTRSGAALQKSMAQSLQARTSA
jgi:hypothetical protein